MEKKPLFVQHKFKRKTYRCVLLPYLLSVSRNTLLGLAVLVPVMRPIVDATIRTAHIVLSFYSALDIIVLYYVGSTAK